MYKHCRLKARLNRVQRFHALEMSTAASAGRPAIGFRAGQITGMLLARDLCVVVST